ncbi:hypothetical protein [Streptomyces sp. NPDC089799]|uniref:hypothetical protein n=1 Tax=Streptomyces sp. NPDC089799 TaxID=3155066 RepID=UPI003417F45B
MSAVSGQARLARSYTGARRHPWVLGRLGDWVIPFGPYTPAQLVVMGGGALLLIKTFAWWSWLGPVPVVLWGVSVWLVRDARIGGQSPFTAVLGLVTLLSRPAAGRIGGRPARDRTAGRLAGAFVIEPGTPLHACVPAPDAVKQEQEQMPPRVQAVVAAGSGLARLTAGVPAGRK